MIRRLVSTDKHSLDGLASCQKAKKVWASRVGCLLVRMINGRSIGGMERKEIVKRQATDTGRLAEMSPSSVREA